MLNFLKIIQNYLSKKVLLLAALLLTSSCYTSNSNTRLFGYDHVDKRIIYGKLVAKNAKGEDISKRCGLDIYPARIVNKRILKLRRRAVKQRNFIKPMSGIFLEGGPGALGINNIYASNIRKAYNLYAITGIRCLGKNSFQKITFLEALSGSKNRIPVYHRLGLNVPIVVKPGSGKTYFGDIFLEMDDGTNSSDFVKKLLIRNKNKETTRDLVALVPQLQNLRELHSVVGVTLDRSAKIQNQKKGKKAVENFISNF